MFSHLGKLFTFKVVLDVALVDEDLFPGLPPIHSDVQLLYLFLEAVFVTVTAVSFGEGTDSINQRVMDFQRISPGWVLLETQPKESTGNSTGLACLGLADAPVHPSGVAFTLIKTLKNVSNFLPDSST